MIGSVTEAPPPAVDSGSKPEEHSDGGGFVSMLAGIVSGQTRPTDQNQQPTDRDDSSSSSKQTDQVDSATKAAVTETKTAAQEQTPADKTQAGANQTEAQAKAVPVDTAKAEQQAGAAAQAVTPGLTAQEAKVMAAASQAAAVTVAVDQPQPKAPEAKAEVPATGQTDKQGVVDALKSLTTERPQPKTMPEVAKPEAEIAATLTAARLNPMGQNSLTGAVLPGADSPSQAKESSSDGPAKNIAAAAVAGAKKPEQAPADAGTKIQVEWQPTEPVTISAASNRSFQDTLQFANGNTRQSELKDTPAENSNPQQAFGVEMKTQLGTDNAVRQVQSAPAQAPQTDPTLGEKMVGQIVREVTLHKLGDNTTLSIRLDPPELGTLRVSVTSQSGVLTTQLESPNAVVRGILETHLPALKEALAGAGVEVSKFSVSSGLDFGQNAQRQQQAWQPTRMAPAVEFNPQMQGQQPVMQAVASGNQAASASFSWLA